MKQEGKNVEIAFIGLIGVLIGAGITGIAVFFVFKYIDLRLSLIHI